MFADDTPHTAIFERDEPTTPLYPAWADAPIDAAPDTPAGTPGHSTFTPEPAAMQDLREMAEPEADPGLDAGGIDLPLPCFHTTGSQLRHRLVTPESIAELQAGEKPSLLQSLFRWK